MQQCPRCGAQLPPHAHLCPTCIQSLVPTPASRQPGSISDENDVPQLPFPSNTSYGYQQAVTGPHRATRFPAHAGVTSPGQGRVRSRLSRGLIALICILILVFLAGGVVYYSAIARPAQLQADANATAQVVQASTHATATAQTQVATQASATASANAHATATVQAQGTVQAQATTTALQNLYTQSTSGVPVLSSSLARQTDSQWDVYTAQDGGGCAFSNGALHASIIRTNFYVPCFAQATRFSNFAFEAQVMLLKGDMGGIIFRANPDTTMYYVFLIGHDGSLRLLASKDDRHSTTLINNKSSLIKTAYGQPNILTVIAQGNSLNLYINKQFAAHINDSTFASGAIGVVAEDSSNPTDVAFNNVRVWKI